MKVFDIRPFIGESLSDVVRYLTETLATGLRDLYTSLRKLSFADNFATFTWEGDVAAGATVTISNAFGSIPRDRIITRCVPLAAGTVIIDDTQTRWTNDHLKLRNTGTAGARLRVVFFQ